MKFEIKNRWNGELIFSIETETWKLAVEAAIKGGADLRYANLRSADLSSADLSSANLRSADLSYANLRSADLRSADLSYANLRSANLRSANLRYANLRSADLSSADLSYANLRSADLRSADLSSADLRSAEGIKDILQIGPIGSRRDYLIAIQDDKDKLKIIAGCWTGTVDEFEKRVRGVHGDNEHGLDYMTAISLIRSRFKVDKKGKARS